MKKMKVLGCMSGTSLDGIDFSLCEISDDIKLMDNFSAKFSKPIYKKLLLCVENKLKTSQTVDLHFELGRFYASIINRYKKKSIIDLVGLHGQTVYHNQGVSTLQLGEPSFIAESLKKPVVFDFRSRHIAAGKLGAPISHFFHKKLKVIGKVKVFQNIGGISNLTYINKNHVITFDTGPGNMLIDGFMKTIGKVYDKNGKLALNGMADMKIVNRYLKTKVITSYKNFGREQFGEKYLQTLLKNLRGKTNKDKAATISEITVRSILNGYKKLPHFPDTIILCGGGALNEYFVKRLKILLPKSKIILSDAIGWPVKYVEASMIAYLAALRYQGVKVQDCKTLLGKIV